MPDKKPQTEWTDEEIDVWLESGGTKTPSRLGETNVPKPRVIKPEVQLRDKRLAPERIVPVIPESEPTPEISSIHPEGSQGFKNDVDRHQNIRSAFEKANRIFAQKGLDPDNAFRVGLLEDWEHRILTNKELKNQLLSGDTRKVIRRSWEEPSAIKTKSFEPKGTQETRNAVNELVQRLAGMDHFNLDEIGKGVSSFSEKVLKANKVLLNENPDLNYALIKGDDQMARSIMEDIESWSKSQVKRPSANISNYMGMLKAKHDYHVSAGLKEEDDPVVLDITKPRQPEIGGPDNVLLRPAGQPILERVAEAEVVPSGQEAAELFEEGAELIPRPESPYGPGTLPEGVPAFVEKELTKGMGPAAAFVTLEREFRPKEPDTLPTVTAKSMAGRTKLERSQLRTAELLAIREEASAQGNNWSVNKVDDLLERNLATQEGITRDQSAKYIESTKENVRVHLRNKLPEMILDTFQEVSNHVVNAMPYFPPAPDPQIQLSEDEIEGQDALKLIGAKILAGSGGKVKADEMLSSMIWEGLISPDSKAASVIDDLISGEKTLIPEASITENGARLVMMLASLQNPDDVFRAVQSGPKFLDWDGLENTVLDPTDAHIRSTSDHQPLYLWKENDPDLLMAPIRPEKKLKPGYEGAPEGLTELPRASSTPLASGAFSQGEINFDRLRQMLIQAVRPGTSDDSYEAEAELVGTALGMKGMNGAQWMLNLIEQERFDPFEPENIKAAKENVIRLMKLTYDKGTFESFQEFNKSQYDFNNPVSWAGTSAQSNRNYINAAALETLYNALNMMGASGVSDSGYDLQGVMNSLAEQSVINHVWRTSPSKGKNQTNPRISRYFETVGDDWYDLFYKKKKWEDGLKTFMGASGEMPGGVLLESAARDAALTWMFGKQLTHFLGNTLRQDLALYLPQFMGGPAGLEPDQFQTFNALQHTPELADAMVDHFTRLINDFPTEFQKNPADGIALFSLLPAGGAGLARLYGKAVSTSAKVGKEGVKIGYIQRKIQQKILKKKILEVDAPNNPKIKKKIDRLDKQITKLSKDLEEAQLKGISKFEDIPVEILKKVSVDPSKFAKVYKEALDEAHLIDAANPGLQLAYKVESVLSKAEWITANLDPFTGGITLLGVARRKIGSMLPDKAKSWALSPEELLTTQVKIGNAEETTSLLGMIREKDARTYKNVMKAIRLGKKLPKNLQRVIEDIMRTPEKYGGELMLIMPKSVVERNSKGISEINKRHAEQAELFENSSVETLYDNYNIAVTREKDSFRKAFGRELDDVRGELATSGRTFESVTQVGDDGKQILFRIEDAQSPESYEMWRTRHDATNSAWDLYYSHPSRELSPDELIAIKEGRAQDPRRKPGELHSMYNASPDALADANSTIPLPDDVKSEVLVLPYGTNTYEIEFISDADRAVYVATSRKMDFLATNAARNWLKNTTDLSSKEIRSHGTKIREHLKNTIQKGRKPGAPIVVGHMNPSGVTKSARIEDVVMTQVPHQMQFVSQMDHVATQLGTLLELRPLDAEKLIDSLPLDADDASSLKLLYTKAWAEKGDDVQRISGDLGEVSPEGIHSKPEARQLNAYIKRTQGEMQRRGAMDLGTPSPDVADTTKSIFDAQDGIQIFTSPSGHQFVITQKSELLNTRNVLDDIYDGFDETNTWSGTQVELRDSLEYASLTVQELHLSKQRSRRVESQQRRLESAEGLEYSDEILAPLRNRLNNLKSAQTEDLRKLRERIDAEIQLTEQIGTGVQAGKKSREEAFSASINSKERRRSIRISSKTKEDAAWLKNLDSPSDDVGVGTGGAQLRSDEYYEETAQVLRELGNSYGAGVPREYFVDDFHSGNDVRVVRAKDYQSAKFIEQIETGKTSTGYELTKEQRMQLVERFDLHNMVDAPDLGLRVADIRGRQYLDWVNDSFDFEDLTNVAAVYMHKTADNTSIPIAQLNVASKHASTLRTEYLNLGSQAVMDGYLAPDVYLSNMAIYSPDMYLQHEKLFSQVIDDIGTKAGEKNFAKRLKTVAHDAMGRMKRSKYKHLPIEEKEAMGLIRGEAYTQVKGLVELSQLVEEARLYRELANAVVQDGPYKGQKLVQESDPGGYVQLKSGQTKWWGKGTRPYGRYLKDKWVPQELADFLVESHNIPNAAFKAYNKLLGLWKMTVTAYNLPLHFRNFQQGMAMSDMIGLNPAVNASARETFNEAFGQAWRLDGELYEEAMTAGLMGTDLLTHETNRQLSKLVGDFNSLDVSKKTMLEIASGLTDFAAVKHLMKQATKATGKVAVKAVATFLYGPKKMREVMERFYQWEDEAFKLWRFSQIRVLQKRFSQTRHVDSEMISVFGNRDAALKVLGPAEVDPGHVKALLSARDEALQYWPDYSHMNRPKTINVARNTTQPFIMYQYGAYPGAVTAQNTRAYKRFLYRTAVDAMNYYSLHLDGTAPEEHELEQMALEHAFLPFYGQQTSTPTGKKKLRNVSGMDVSTGQYYPMQRVNEYVNFGSFQPFGAVYRGDPDAKDPMTQIPQLQINHPAYTGIFRPFWVNQNFRGDELGKIEVGDPRATEEGWLPVFQDMSRNLLPAYSPGIPGVAPGRAVQKLQAVIEGRGNYRDQGVVQSWGTFIDENVFGAARYYGQSVQATRDKLTEREKEALEGLEFKRKKEHRKERNKLRGPRAHEDFYIEHEKEWDKKVVPTYDKVRRLLKKGKSIKEMKEQNLITDFEYRAVTEGVTESFEDWFKQNEAIVERLGDVSNYKPSTIDEEFDERKKAIREHYKNQRDFMKQHMPMFKYLINRGTYEAKKRKEETGLPAFRTMKPTRPMSREKLLRIYRDAK